MTSLASSAALDSFNTKEVRPTLGQNRAHLVVAFVVLEKLILLLDLRFFVLWHRG